MTLEKAKELLEEEYERAERLEYVHNPLAYALYHVWKMADKGRVCTQTDLRNKCGSCKWSVPCKFSEKSTLGFYVECLNPNKVWRHKTSKLKQRTTTKCRYYERSENAIT